MLERLEAMIDGETLAVWDHCGMYDDGLSEVLRAVPALLAVAKAAAGALDALEKSADHGVPLSIHMRAVTITLRKALAQLKEQADA